MNLSKWMVVVVAGFGAISSSYGSVKEFTPQEFESITLFENAVSYPCSKQAEVVQKFGEKGNTCLQVLGQIHSKKPFEKRPFSFQGLSGGVLVFDQNAELLGNLKLEILRGSKKVETAVAYVNPKGKTGTISSRLLQYAQARLDEAVKLYQKNPRQRTSVRDALQELGALEFVLTGKYSNQRHQFEAVKPELVLDFYYKGQGNPSRKNPITGKFTRIFDTRTDEFYSRLDHYLVGINIEAELKKIEEEKQVDLHAMSVELSDVAIWPRGGKAGFLHNLPPEIWSYIATLVNDESVSEELTHRLGALFEPPRENYFVKDAKERIVQAKAELDSVLPTLITREENALIPLLKRRVVSFRGVEDADVIAKMIELFDQDYDQLSRTQRKTLGSVFRQYREIIFQERWLWSDLKLFEYFGYANRYVMNHRYGILRLAVEVKSKVDEKNK